MSYLVLARKYRPQTFEEVVGQHHITQTLQNAIKTNRVAHALLFAGPRGVGKTSVARIMAKAMNCVEGPTPSPCNVCASCREITDGVSLDVLEIDGASNRGINEIRELRENIKYMPSRGRFKIYIIDEVHMLTMEAFNALLKTLEEPPAHVLFFFATTEPHKIPITIHSRCQRHNFKRISLSDTVGCLRRICQDLSFQISEESLRALAREATGGLRDALSLLDQVVAYSGKNAEDRQVLESIGAIDRRILFDLSRAIFDGDVVAALNTLDELYSQGYDLKRLYSQMLEHLRHMLVLKMAGGASGLVDALEDEVEMLTEQTKQLSLEGVSQVLTMWFEAEPSIRFSTQPRFALEVLFIKLGECKRLASFDRIVERLDQVAKTLETGAAQRSQNDPARTHPVPQASDGEVGKTSDDPMPIQGASLKQTWEQLLALFNEQCTFLAPSLEKASLTKLGDDFLEMTVQGNSFFAARLQDPKSMEAIRTTCRQFFNRPMDVRVQVEKAEKQEANAPKETGKTRQLKKDALNHPVVADALEVFQGRVVDVKILKP